MCNVIEDTLVAIRDAIAKTDDKHSVLVQLDKLHQYASLHDIVMCLAHIAHAKAQATFNNSGSITEIKEYAEDADRLEYVAGRLHN